MDFRTEWSSWGMMALMLLMSYLMAPEFQSGFPLLFQTVGYPFFTIALATIPVLIYCAIRKIEPDIDYSIRVGFVIMLIIFVRYYFFK